MRVHAIASYVPAGRLDTFSLMDIFGVSSEFIRDKLGILSVARRSDDEDISDMCVAAFNALLTKVSIMPEEIDTLILVTQNPEQRIPHTSAIVHTKLGLGSNCACFDISQGCAGYVYGLVAATAFMRECGRRKGLLFTCDPYSKIIDPYDKNTAMLFGDAATVTYLSPEGSYEIEASNFGSAPGSCEHLSCDEGGKLFMNGREIFNFVLKDIPLAICSLMQQCGLQAADIDTVFVHQGSKYIVDSLRNRLPWDETKLRFLAGGYGNTVSSSLPLLFEGEIGRGARFLFSGFGVGLAWGNMILRMIEE